MGTPTAHGNRLVIGAGTGLGLGLAQLIWDGSHYRVISPARLAVAALGLFVEAYGTKAGNFALSSLALGGVYIAGGIAPKLIEQLKAPRFMAAFRNKGKMAGLMQHAGPRGDES